MVVAVAVAEVHAVVAPAATECVGVVNAACSEYGWCGTSDAHCSGGGGGGGGNGGGGC
jgi:hypothetical protein